MPIIQECEGKRVYLISPETGVKVGKKAMENYNEFIERMPSLEKWSMIISPGYFDNNEECILTNPIG